MNTDSSCTADSGGASAGHEFRCVFYDHRCDNLPKPAAFETFRAFASAAVAAGHDRRMIKDGEAFSPVSYKHGAKRGKAGVEYVYAIGLDVEHLSPERADQLFALLGPLERLVYTTHSHKPEAPRYRVILPLARPVPAAVHEKVWHGVVAWVGADIVDPHTKDCSRIFYTPAAPEGAGGHVLEYHPADGQGVFTLDPVDVLGDDGLDQLEKAADHTLAAAGTPASTPGNLHVLPELPRKLAEKPRPTRADLERRLRAIGREDTRALVDKLLAGEPFATTGSRDATLYSLASTVAWVAPEAEVDDLLPLFEASLAAMGGGADPNNPPPNLDNAREKLTRALAQRRERWIAENEQPFGGLFGSRVAPAATTASAPSAAPPAASPPTQAPPGRERADAVPPLSVTSNALSPDQLETFARSQGCTVRELLGSRLIIQNGLSFYVFGDCGRYKESLTEQAAWRALERDWARFCDAKIVNLWRASKDGPPKRKTMNELISQHGSVARGAAAEMGRETTVYDPTTETMIEGICSVRRDLKARFNPQIAEWLRYLGGRLAPKLEAWLAYLPRLQDPNTLLFLKGEPGTGKNLLVEGSAKVFGRRAQPMPWDQFTLQFNAGIKRCPIVFADEYVPGGRHASKRLRHTVSSSTIVVTKKGQESVEVRGCVRVIVAANNDDALGLAGQTYTDEDIRAVESRILQIDTSPAAAEYLVSIGGRSATEAWVNGDGIAEHVLWLAENCTPQRGPRFLVEGDASGVARKLVTDNPTVVAILEWITRCILDRRRALSGGPYSDGVRIGDGALLVATDAVDGAWAVYAGTRSDRPPTPELARALGHVATGKARPASRGLRRRYYVINVELLCSWAEETGMADPDQLREQINTPARRPADVVTHQPVAA